jgi:hypothetical protein
MCWVALRDEQTSLTGLYTLIIPVSQNHDNKK